MNLEEYGIAGQVWAKHKHRDIYTKANYVRVECEKLNADFYDGFDGGLTTNEYHRYTFSDKSAIIIERDVGFSLVKPTTGFELSCIGPFLLAFGLIVVSLLLTVS